MQQKEILSIQSAVELGRVHSVAAIWRTQPDQLDSLIEQAVAMEKITPVSVNQTLVSVGAQCASELLPDALIGEDNLWTRRMDAFQSHMEIPDGSPLHQAMQRFAGLEQTTGDVCAEGIWYSSYPLPRLAIFSISINGESDE